MQAVIDEFEKHTALVLAAEDWAKSYRNNPEEFGKMLRIEARINRLMLEHFKFVASQVDTFVRWDVYEFQRQQVQAQDEFEVDVIIEETVDELNTQPVIKTLIEPIADATTLGALSAEKTYRIDVGVTKTSQFIQRAAKEQVAGLVGKRIDKDGIIRPNPRAKYHISNTQKKQIREAVNTAISLGETRDEAAKRVQQVVKNRKRADMIAQTESVNAYNNGIHKFGIESGAVGKEWETAGSPDFCNNFEAEGIVPLNHLYTTPYGRKILGPTAHPYCRCFERLVYPEELTG